jgi:hypothetical protein
MALAPEPATISLAAYREMLNAVLAYVPMAQREAARCAALAVGIAYAYDPPPRKENA